MKQLSFLPKPRTEHGGEIRKGKRKLSRPLDPKRPLHLVLRSTKARGEFSFLRPKHEKLIHELLFHQAKKNQVRIYEYANSGNHLHLLIRAKTKPGFQSFLRTTTGLIARAITGAKKGRKASSGKFWDELAYSRIVEWGRAFFHARYYVIQNTREAWGLPTQRKPYPRRP